MNVYMLPGLNGLGGLAGRVSGEYDLVSRGSGLNGHLVGQRYVL